MSNNNNVQPARINYFFNQSYVDLKNIITGVWKKNFATSKMYGSKIASSWGQSRLKGTAAAIAYLFATISMYIFGSIACFSIAAVHVGIILAINLVVYLVALVLRIIEEIYKKVNSIFGACPICHRRYDIPTYICDCNAKHTNLVPGKYGVIKRTCQCGKKLPTSILFGRSKIKAECPLCNRRLDNATGESEMAPLCIPVAGAKSSGKTSYITAVMREMMEDVPAKTQSRFVFFNQSNEAACKGMIERYKSGSKQDKTSDRVPPAYSFYFDMGEDKMKRPIHVYDIAGEAFHEMSGLAAQMQYGYANGFVFVIDPLSIPAVRSQHVGDAEFEAYAASTASIDTVFDAFARTLSGMQGASATDLMKMPCAVVINKIDAYGLEGEIGKTAVNKYMGLEENKGKSYETVTDETVKNFLIKNGMSNFTKNACMTFKNIRFFTVSSQGHNPDGTGFASEGTLEPVSWILSKSDKSLKSLFDTYYKK